MSGDRDTVLDAIRRGLGRSALSAQSRTGLDRRLEGGPPAGWRPPRLEGDRLALFAGNLKQLSATLAMVGGLAAIPQAVAEYLDGHNLHDPIVVAPALRPLDWRNQGLQPRFGPAVGDETAGVSRAFCGIVETGSLVLLSGADNPTTINFLPDHHLVVLRRADLVDHIEEVWTRLRAEIADWPRTVNLISGPSRTADIEQTIQLGAHGPRRLHVLLVP